MNHWRKRTGSGGGGGGGQCDKIWRNFASKKSLKVFGQFYNA